MFFFTTKSNLNTEPVCMTCSLPTCSHINPKQIKNKFLKRYLNYDLEDYVELLDIVYGESKPEKANLNEYFLLKSLEPNPDKFVDLFKFYYSEPIITKRNDKIIFNKCPICNEEYDIDDYDIEMVQCDLCYRWIHLECDKSLKMNDYNELENKEYLCERCLEWNKNVEKMNLNSDCGYKCHICKESFRNEKVFNSYSDMVLYNLIPTLYIHKGCYNETLGQCSICYEENAGLECLYCKSGQKYHLKCSLGVLLVSDLDFPICMNHRINLFQEFDLSSHKKEIEIKKFDLKKTNKILKKLKMNEIKTEDEIGIRIFNFIYFNNYHFMRISYEHGLSIIEYNKGIFYHNFKENDTIQSKYEIYNIDEFFGLSNLDYIRSNIKNYDESVAKILKKKFEVDWRFDDEEPDCECYLNDKNRKDLKENKKDFKENEEDLKENNLMENKENDFNENKEENNSTFEENHKKRKRGRPKRNSLVNESNHENENNLMNENTSINENILNESKKIIPDLKCMGFKDLLKNHTLSCLFYLLQKTPYILKKSKIEGFGLFANKDFIPNEPIIQYFGEYISPEEADKREKYYNNRIYMFKFENIVIDATIIGNMARYMNHSCNPNCYSTVVYNCGVNILICANRYIRMGEELTYDYKLSKGKKIKCLCNSSNCKEYFK